MIVTIMVGTCYLEEFQLVHEGIYIFLQTERLIPRYDSLHQKFIKDPNHDCVSNLIQNTLKTKIKKRKEKWDICKSESPCVHKFSSDSLKEMLMKGLFTHLGQGYK